MFLLYLSSFLFSKAHLLALWLALMDAEADAATRKLLCCYERATSSNQIVGVINYPSVPILSSSLVVVVAVVAVVVIVVVVIGLPLSLSLWLSSSSSSSSSSSVTLNWIKSGVFVGTHNQCQPSGKTCARTFANSNLSVYLSIQPTNQPTNQTSSLHPSNSRWLLLSSQ